MKRRIASSVWLSFSGRGVVDAARSELLRALARARGNVLAAARDLGIGRATLYRKMKDLGIDSAAKQR